MLRLLSLLFFVVLCTCVRAPCGPAGLYAQTPLLATPLEQSWEESIHWQETNELDGRFRLLAPTELQHASDTVETALGHQVFHTFHLQAPDQKTAENIIYALSYVDYPPGSLHHDSLELVSELLATTEQETVDALGGELIYAADKTISGYPARQWRIDYPSQGRLASARTLAGVAGNRYYEIKVFSLRSSGVSKAGDRFFDSLRLFAPPEQ